MAILNTSFKKVKEYLNKEITIQDLENILFDFGLEIDFYNPEEDELKIEITADRSDLLSFQGFIRALRSYLGLEKSRSYKVNKSKYSVKVDSNLENIRPYTVCAVIKNLDLDDSKIKEIIWAQEKLHFTLSRKRKVAAIGIYPLENIEFPITFKAKKPEEISFIPLGLDVEQSAKEILDNHPKGREYKHLLEDKDMYPIFIDNKKNILSMPPIINSKKTGNIKSSTKDVFIECSGFNLERLKQVLNILVTMFSDFGGDIYLVNVVYKNMILKTPNLDYEKRVVSNNYLNKLLGTNILIDDTCKYLEKMQYVCKKKGKDNIEVLIPPFRSDVLHDVDIADDLARAYGFSNIEYRTPQINTIGELLASSIQQDNIISIMTSLGFQEIKTLSLSNKKKLFEDFKIEASSQNYMPLGYSKDKTIDCVVNWLTPKLFDILLNNQHKFFPQKLFSCDYVVKKDDSLEVRSKTVLHLCGLFSNYKVSFTKMSSEIFTLFNLLGLEFTLKKKNYSFYVKGRSAEIICNSKSVGHIGEIDPSVLKNKEYYMPVCSFEIDFSKIY
jgi:phenylalanyl-tRNA synthetase beta chain